MKTKERRAAIEQLRTIPETEERLVPPSHGHVRSSFEGGCDHIQAFSLHERLFASLFDVSSGTCGSKQKSVLIS